MQNLESKQKHDNDLHIIFVFQDTGISFHSHHIATWPHEGSKGTEHYNSISVDFSITGFW
jgi:hypothetical protein